MIRICQSWIQLFLFFIEVRILHCRRDLIPSIFSRRILSFARGLVSMIRRFIKQMGRSIHSYFVQSLRVDTFKLIGSIRSLLVNLRQRVRVDRLWGFGFTCWLWFLIDLPVKNISGWKINNLDRLSRSFDRSLRRRLWVSLRLRDIQNAVTTLNAIVCVFQEIFRSHTWFIHCGAEFLWKWRNFLIIYFRRDTNSLKLAWTCKHLFLKSWLNLKASLVHWPAENIICNWLVNLKFSDSIFIAL